MERIEVLDENDEIVPTDDLTFEGCLALKTLCHQKVWELNKKSQEIAKREGRVPKETFINDGVLEFI